MLNDAIKKYKMMRSKKAQVEELLYNAFRIGFMFIAMLAFFILINYYIVNKMDTNYIQSQVLLNRILYSDAIMMQNTDTGTVQTGIVDIKKLEDAYLDSSISYGNYKRHAAAKITLLNKNPDREQQLLKEAFLNREQYKNWEVLIRAGVGGKGSATNYTTVYPVTYLWTDNKYYYGTLMISIIIPNS
jgi:hypothetical protein